MQRPEPEPMPGYGQLLRRGYRSLAGAARGCADCGWELSRRTWADHAHLAWGEALLCLLCAAGWTLLRHAAARRLFRVSALPCPATAPGPHARPSLSPSRHASGGIPHHADAA